MLREGRGLALGFPVQPDPASFPFSLKMVGLSWLGGSQPSARKGRRSSSSRLTLCNPRPVTCCAQIPGRWPSVSFVPGSQTAQAQPAGQGPREWHRGAPRAKVLGPSGSGVGPLGWVSRTSAWTESTHCSSHCTWHCRSGRRRGPGSAALGAPLGCALADGCWFPLAGRGAGTPCRAPGCSRPAHSGRWTVHTWTWRRSVRLGAGLCAGLTSGWREQRELSSCVQGEHGALFNWQCGSYKGPSKVRGICLPKGTGGSLWAGVSKDRFSPSHEIRPWPQGGPGEPPTLTQRPASVCMNGNRMNSNCVNNKLLSLRHSLPSNNQ